MHDLAVIDIKVAVELDIRTRWMNEGMKFPQEVFKNLYLFIDSLLILNRYIYNFLITEADNWVYWVHFRRR